MDQQETKHGWSKVTVKNVKQQHALAELAKLAFLLSILILYQKSQLNFMVYELWVCC